MAAAAAPASVPPPSEGAGAGAGASLGPDSGNKFQHAISAWRTVDLTNLVSDMDNTASEIVAYQRDSTVQRKDLAAKTKDFRKLDDTTKLSEIKGLLKAYQTFIDLLTNHSRAVNSAFLKSLASISEAPDPYPLLEASVDSMLATEDTLPKLMEENQHLQKNVTKLTAQLDETESRLQAERAARQSLEDNLESRVKEAEKSWVAVLDEKKDNWEAKEKALEEKVESQERLLNEIKASYEVNQRLGKATEDGDVDGRHVVSAEIEMLHSDLERTSSRLAEVEARNEQLRVELAQAKSQVPQQATLVEDDPAFMRMRSENSSLVRKLDSARLEKETLKRDLDTRMRGLEREVGLLKEERDNLRGKVQKWGDYEDLKQELEVLKSIEFATGDDDDVRDGAGGAQKSAEADTLEKLLVARNKKLSDELTILRVSHQDLQARLDGIQEDLSKTNAELEKAQNLNEKLENDLATMQSEGANAFPSGASVAGTYVNRYAPSVAPTRRGGRISPTSSIISGINPRNSDGEMVGGGGVGPGILPMITAQRDRFKKRMAQLEVELSESHKTVSKLRQEVTQLQEDNLKLYEKTRYVSAYNRGGGPAASTSSSSTVYASNSNPSTVNMGTAGTVGLDRYRKAYESNLSPFAAWRGQESARAYRRMSLPERMVYSVARAVFASRTSRNVFAAYCVALHLLVFMALYWMGSCDLDTSQTGLGGTTGAGAAGLASAAKAVVEDE